MLLNLRDVMRLSGAVVSSSGTIAAMNSLPYTRTTVSKPSKPGTAMSAGSKARDSFDNYDTNERRIGGPLGTKGMAWSHSASARNMTTATEKEGSMPVFSTVIAGLYDEHPVGTTARRASDEEGGDIRYSIASSPEGGDHPLTSRDPYAYGASDDEGDEENLFDEYHNHNRRRHIHIVSVSAHRVVEEIELGERTPTRRRAHQGPAVEHSAHPHDEMGPVLRSQGAIWGGTDTGENGQGPHPRMARWAPGRPVRGDQGSDGGSVFLIE
jgi:hypothetical protein